MAGWSQPLPYETARESWRQGCAPGARTGELASAQPPAPAARVEGAADWAGSSGKMGPLLTASTGTGRNGGDPMFSRRVCCFPFSELRESTLRGTRGSDCSGCPPGQPGSPLARCCGSPSGSRAQLSGGWGVVPRRGGGHGSLGCSRWEEEAFEVKTWSPEQRARR